MKRVQVTSFDSSELSKEDLKYIRFIADTLDIKDVVEEAEELLKN